MSTKGPRRVPKKTLPAHCYIPKMGIAMPEMGARPRNQKQPHVRRQPTSGDGPGSLADVLFTTTQQRVLGLLFGQPERSFFATELIELTESGAVQVPA